MEAQIVMGWEGESRTVMPTKWHQATWPSSRLVPVTSLGLGCGGGDPALPPMHIVGILGMGASWSVDLDTSHLG